MSGQPAPVPGAPPTARRTDMMDLLRELYPRLRSLTGEGVRWTLDRLREELPALRTRSVPSGRRVFDWTVPPEWNVREAYVEAPDGRRIADVARHSLHLVSYSEPVRGDFTLAELRPHLHSLPDRPHAIPYRTSYYARDWGFCLPHRELEALREGSYKVVVDSTLDDEGRLDFADLLLPGSTHEEVLFSAHVCHPSLANDNLSAVVVLVELARRLARRPGRRFGYRFVFAPATVGALAFLAETPEVVGRLRHGLVVAGVGDPGPLTYKRTRDESAIDRAVEHVLRHRGSHAVLPFAPTGYDERQYNSPGFRLPVGRLSRTPHGTYPEYHTSDDDPDFVRASSLADAADALEEVVDVLEHDAAFVNRAPYGEPQLGRRGLYRSLGGNADRDVTAEALLWVLNLADGEHTLLDTAERAGLPFRTVLHAQRLLSEHDLLAPVEPR